MYLKRFQNLYDFKRTRVPEPRSEALRLHRNEKPDNWPREFLDKIFATVPDNFLQCYPNHRPFYSKLSKFLGLPEDRFIVTSGIDEAVKSLLTLCCGPGDSYAAVWPGYAMYLIYGRILGAEMAAIEYDPNRFMPPSEVLGRTPLGAKVLFLPNPSQPVENCFNLDQLREIATGCAERDILFAVDEAYHFFGAVSAAPLTEEFDNVIVMRTFSKAFGGGALRLGYVIGSKRSLAPLAAFRLAHEANAITYHIASALLSHFDTYVEQSIDAICRGRDYFREQCLEYGLRTWGEVSNNVLVDMGTSDKARKVGEGLDKKDILVRGGYPKPLDHCIMVTCGPPEMMKTVFDGMRDILES